MDIMAFAEHGQPMNISTLARKRRLLGGSRRQRLMSPVLVAARYEDVKKCDLDAKTFSSGKGGILMGYSARQQGEKAERGGLELDD